MILSIICVALVAIAELIIILVSPMWGMIIHAMILMCLVVGSSITIGSHPICKLFVPTSCLTSIVETTGRKLMGSFLLGHRVKSLSSALAFPIPGVSLNSNQPRSGVTLSILLNPFPNSLSERRLCLALVIVPLTRILSLATPLEHLSINYWYFITAFPVLAAAFVLLKILAIDPADIGLTLKRMPMQWVIAFTGIPLGFIEYLCLRPEPVISNITWETVVLTSLIFLVAIAFVEELIFRGILQHIATKVMGGWGLLFVAMAFAVLHIGYLSALDFVVVLMIGLYFGWIVQQTKSLVGVTLSHGITNICLYLCIPLALQV